MGLVPLAVRAFPFLVNSPNLLSSWKNRLAVSYLASDDRISSWHFCPKFF